MLIACKCLNITISSSETNNESPRPFNFVLDDFQLQKESLGGDHFQFFKEALGPLSNVRISKEIDTLIQAVSVVNDWTLNRCNNCKTLVYATNGRDQDCLVNSALMTNQEEINNLKSSDNYSPIFKIVVNVNTLDFTDYFGKNSRSAVIESPRVKILEQRIQEFMENETAAANERILRYTEQQFSIVKMMRERAAQEYQLLKNTIKNVPEQINTTNIDENTIESDLMSNNKILTNEATLETPPATPEYIPMSTGNSPPLNKSLDVAQHQQPTLIRNQNLVYNSNNINSVNNNNYNNQKGAINKQHSSTNNQNQAKLSTDSFDSDCLFDIDGMDNDKSPLSNNTLSDDEDCGFDDSNRNAIDDGVYIPRQLGRQASVAKSLPISMPVIMSQFRMTEEDVEEVNEENVDIAASIKALARSVHGDTVFGDLPRPRFSTQI